MLGIVYIFLVLATLTLNRAWGNTTFMCCINMNPKRNIRCKQNSTAPTYEFRRFISFPEFFEKFISFILSGSFILLILSLLCFFCLNHIIVKSIHVAFLCLPFVINNFFIFLVTIDDILFDKRVFAILFAFDTCSINFVFRKHQVVRISFCSRRTSCTPLDSVNSTLHWFNGMNVFRFK